MSIYVVHFLALVSHVAFLDTVYEYIKFPAHVVREKR